MIYKITTLSLYLSIILLSPAFAQTSVELKSKAEQAYEEQLEKIKEERAKETSRFKKKAIENTQAREKRQQELLQEKKDKASRFTKKAMEKTELKKQKTLQKQQKEPESRFTKKAMKKAEQRAKKLEEKQKKLHRNNNQ